MTDIGHEPRLEPAEPRAVHQCSECGEPIREGEFAYNFSWGWICETCAANAYEVVE